MINNNIYKTDGKDAIYLLRWEDYESVLEENYSEEEIQKIKDNFSEEQIISIMRDKINIDWESAIKDVIDFRLLKK